MPIGNKNTFLFCIENAALGKLVFYKDMLKKVYFLIFWSSRFSPFIFTTTRISSFYLISDQLSAMKIAVWSNCIGEVLDENMLQYLNVSFFAFINWYDSPLLKNKFNVSEKDNDKTLAIHLLQPTFLIQYLFLCYIYLLCNKKSKKYIICI